MKKYEQFLSCAVVASVSLAMAGTANAAAPTLTATTILTQLDNPWDMAFTQDGAMFFTEKCRGLSVRLPSGVVNKLVGMKDSTGYAETMPDLFCDGQAGMNGVAVDPDFANNKFVYVYSASSKSTPQTNRVLRLKVNADFTQMSDRNDIVENIPYKTGPSDHPFGASGAHNGGRIRFSPGDGFLYVTTGDTHNGVVPQSPTKLGGKVLRIDRDGNPAPGNAAPPGFDSRVFTYGHRNVVRAVAGGLTRSGSVDGYVWEVLNSVEPDLTAQTRIIARSERLGFPPFVARSDRTGETAVQACAAALQSFEQTDQGQAVLRLLFLDSISAADPSLFDGIATRMADLRGG